MQEPLKQIDFLSPQQKRELLKKMLAEKSGTEEDRVDGLSEGGCLYEFPPEFLALKQRVAELESLVGFRDVYFNVSEGINNNTTRIKERELVNFCSYNYIGMSGDPVVSRAAKEAIDRYGTSVSASHPASGERPLHRELKEAVAALLGTEDCIIFVSGYVTNESVIGHIMRPPDLILYDSYIHASIQQGSRLSGATVRPFPHNNWEALDEILKTRRSNYKQVLIVIEGVYSMDGDIPDLPRFIEVKKRHRALLMIDEAHSIGVLGKTGRGIGEHFRVDRADVDLWMGTLSKSFASCGGYIASTKSMIEFLRATVPGFVYSVGMPPPNTAAVLAAVKLMLEEPERVLRLQQNAALFLALAHEKGLDTGKSRGSAVVPIMVGNSLDSIRLYKALFAKGIYALPMMYPTVPEGAARLRFFLSSTHTEEQILYTVETLAEAMPECRTQL